MFENGPEVSVVIPTYNEAAVIGRVVRGVYEVLEQMACSAEVLVIDDGSDDGTGQVAEAAGAYVIRHPYNLGNGAGIKTGIRAARGAVLVMLDGDGQHDPADIPRLVGPLHEGYHMVVGARGPGSQQAHRLVANKIYNSLASYVAGFQVKDLTSGFRAIRSELAQQFCYMLPNAFSYPTTLTIAIANGGYSLKYVEIHAAKRVGKSKIRPLRDGMRFLMIISKITTLFSQLKVFLPAGLAVLLPGILYAVYKLIAGKSWTLPIMLSLSVGTLIIMLGFLTEQIALLRVQHIDRIARPEGRHPYDVWAVESQQAAASPTLGAAPRQDVVTSVADLNE
jgi:glycosyltransferase involved in cell wall biosynthesis